MTLPKVGVTSPNVGILASERTAKWAREKKVRPAPEEPYFPGEGASGVWELACDRHDFPIKATKSGKKVYHL